MSYGIAHALTGQQTAIPYVLAPLAQTRSHVTRVWNNGTTNPAQTAQRQWRSLRLASGIQFFLENAVGITAPSHVHAYCCVESLQDPHPAPFVSLRLLLR